MSGIKETLKEKYPWMIYIVLFVIVFALFLLFNRFNFFQTNPDSARYMLSALVQSEAAIVAIVITLSLVAVQLTASSYSPRVTEIFRKAPDLWILMISYIAAIIYGLGILKLIEATLELNLECYIRFAYFFGIFCFAALIPYTGNMFIMLKPSTIIDKLSLDITKENLSCQDPIQPITDILKNSLINDDRITIKNCLDAIGERVCDIIRQNELNITEQSRISAMLYDHFDKIFNISLNFENKYSSILLIEKIEVIGTSSTEKCKEIIASCMIDELKKWQKNIADKNFFPISIMIVRSIGNIGKIATKDVKRNIAWKATRYLGEIGKRATEEDINIASLSIEYLKEIEKIADGVQFEEIQSMANRYINEISNNMEIF